ncbi:MAG: YkgJ family cysteine cluster protein [Heliobacteriaceae bacterium]|nr:YkgJ family cysteine cluster protein [Heliobacteriaceae bacterium]
MTEKKFINERPQELCKMCGRCCRVATGAQPYAQILKLAQEGNQGAVDFLSLFEPYPSVEAAREADNLIVDNIIRHYRGDDLTFYHCKYLLEDNLCGKYEARLPVCRCFPSSPWAVVPPGCGFEGYLFWKQEEEKQHIRLAKEELIDMEVLKSKHTEPEILNKISRIEEKLKNKIESYAQYGSQLW